MLVGEVLQADIDELKKNKFVTERRSKKICVSLAKNCLKRRFYQADDTALIPLLKF